MRNLIAAVLLSTLAANECRALDHIVLRQDDAQVEVAGKVLVTAEDGGLLAIGRDGRMWPVKPEELLRRRADPTPFTSLSPAEMAKQLEGELPRGFAVHQTKHYLICYDTSTAYAEWCGSLFERLYRGFTSFWEQRGFELVEPEFPLVAIVFGDKARYEEFARAELGDAVTGIIGYYSFRSNRMTMYDLSGVQSLRAPGDRRSSVAEINRMLARPQAERTVATIIHEATHQIAYNCGLQVRYADNPMWVSEGLAMYFETPDLNSRQGWRSIGKVNRVRLNHWRTTLPHRTHNTLRLVISDDMKFRDSASQQQAYSEAWALNYYLMRSKSDEYDQYLKALGKKEHLLWATPEERIEEFEKHFGDLETFETDYLRSMRRVR